MLGGFVSSNHEFQKKTSYVLRGETLKNRSFSSKCSKKVGDPKWDFGGGPIKGTIVKSHYNTCSG